MATAKTGKKSGLGKGLDALIPEKNTTPKKAASGEPSKEGVMLSIDKVEPNRDQPRKNFDEDALSELADSIRQYGIIEPIVVVDKKDYYQIVSGERRWRAARIADLKEVPVVIKDLTEQQIVEISLIENIQREDLNPIEEALAYKRLLDEFHMKQDEVAERVSKSRTVVANSVRLLKLDERVQNMIVDGKITTGHARTILGIEDKEGQFALAEKVFDERLSVRETEKLVKQAQREKIAPKPKTAAIDSQTEAIYHDLEEEMKKKFGTKVAIVAKDTQRGKVEIEYFSSDELDRIIELVRSI